MREAVSNMKKRLLYKIERRTGKRPGDKPSTIFIRYFLPGREKPYIVELGKFYVTFSGIVSAKMARENCIIEIQFMVGRKQVSISVPLDSKENIPPHHLN